ncbi:hypothetical protein GMMP15_1590019 [Candidatus Magnetomoraceae bacterium gMMP-15]
MDNTIAYYKIENEIYVIDGILSFLKATRTKLFSAILLYILVLVFEYILKKPIEFTGNWNTLAEHYDEIKNIYDKFGKVLTVVSDMNNPFFSERFRN